MFDDSIKIYIHFVFRYHEAQNIVIHSFSYIINYNYIILIIELDK